MARNVVNIEEVSKAFDIRPLLDQVSLGVSEGDRIGIVGRNGSGKTTILKAISNLIAYKGTIECPYVTTYLSQEPLLFNMSVLDNILYPLRIRKIEPNIQVLFDFEN